MQNLKNICVATAQPCVAGKQPFRIKFGMTGVLSPFLSKSFVGFVGFVTK